MNHILVNVARTITGIALVGAVCVAVNTREHVLSASVGDCLRVPARSRYCWLHEDAGISLVKSGQPAHTIIWFWLGDGSVHITRGDG